MGYRPGSIWIYDTTHFTRAGVPATVVEDLVSRKWLAEIVSVEETSIQVQVVFTQALAAEGLLELVTARQDGLVDPTVLLPPQRPATGRPNNDHRLVVEAMVWLARSGSPCRDLPATTAPGRPSPAASAFGRA